MSDVYVHCKICGANLYDGFCTKCTKYFEKGDILKPTFWGIKAYPEFNINDVMIVRDVPQHENSSIAEFVFFHDCPACKRNNRSGCYGHYLHGSNNMQTSQKLQINFVKVMKKYE